MRLIDKDELLKVLRQRYDKLKQWYEKANEDAKTNASAAIAECFEIGNIVKEQPTVDAVSREELLNTLNGRLDFLQKWRNETADFKNIATAMIEDCEDIIDIIKSLKENKDEPD